MPTSQILKYVELTQIADAYVERFSDIPKDSKDFLNVVNFSAKIITKTDWFHKTYVLERCEKLQPLLLAAKSLTEKSLNRNLFAELLLMIVLVPSPVVDESYNQLVVEKLSGIIREANAPMLFLKLMTNFPASIINEEARRIVADKISKNLGTALENQISNQGRSAIITNNLWIAGVMELFPSLDEVMLEKAIDLLINEVLARGKDQLKEIEIYRIYYNLTRLETCCPQYIYFDTE